MANECYCKREYRIWSSVQTWTVGLHCIPYYFTQSTVCMPDGTLDFISNCFHCFTVKLPFLNGLPIIDSHICFYMCRYENVLSACCLKQDLEIFTHRDQTEVSYSYSLLKRKRIFTVVLDK